MVYTYKQYPLKTTQLFYKTYFIVPTQLEYVLCQHTDYHGHSIEKRTKIFTETLK